MTAPGANDSAYTRSVLRNTANEAESDYQNAGQQTVRLDNATLADWQRALNDPKTTAIWFAGHGVYNTVVGFFGNTKLGNPKESIAFTDGQKRGPVGPFPNIRQVTLHACGQDQQSWRNSFPNANFVSWSGTVRAPTIWWWQFFNRYDQAPRRTARLHPTLEQVNQYFALGDAWINDLHPVSNAYSVPGVASFVLNHRLQRDLNGVSFNFRAYGDGLEVQLFSASMVNGIIDFSTQSDEYNPTAAFDVIIDSEAYNSLLERPFLWLTWSSDPNRVRLDNHSSIPDHVALQGIGVVMFGVPEPASIITLCTGLAGLAALRRKRKTKPRIR